MKTYQKLLLTLLLAMSVSCSSPPPQLPPLKIAALSTWSSYAIPFIAQDRGLFAKHGVSVNLVPIVEYMSGVQLCKEHEVDAAFMALTDVIALESEGFATRFVYATDYSETSDMIIGQATLNSLSDLKGKKVSFDGVNTFSHLLVLKLLEKAGLQEGEFQAANMNPTEAFNALVADKIQAGHIYGVPAYQALAQGYKILGIAGEVPHLLVEGLAVNAHVVNTRREDVQKMVEALVEAMTWLQQFPEEGLHILAQHSHVPETELAAILKGVHVLSLAENQDAFKQKGILLKGGKEIMDFFGKNGTLLHSPDLNQVIEGQFINAIGHVVK